MEARQGRRRARPSSTACSPRSPRACASSPCCCTPSIPRAAESCWRRSARARARARAARALRRARVPARSADSSRCSPSTAPARGVIDSHTHLTPASRRTPSWSPRPRRAGVDADPHGRAGRRDLPRGAGRRRGLPAGLRRDRPPPQPRDRASTTATSPSSRRSPRTTRCRAIGETGLDYFRDYAPRADQERAFHAQIELARATGKPLVIHTRAAEDDTIATLRERADGLDVILHCFSMPDRLEECLDEGWWISFAGNVTYPKNADLAAAAEQVPDDRLLVETDAPYLTPQVVRKERNQPAFVVHTARFVARAPRPVLRGARGGRGAQRRRALRVVTDPLPSSPQPSLRRMRAFDVRPKRDLGQNFLIDSNILGVIERAAELRARRRRAGDRRRAGRAQRAPRAARRAPARRRARPRARAARCATRWTPFANTTLHLGDALALDLAGAGPAADEGGRQPALRHRGDGDPRHGLRAAVGDALGRDGAEGGRRALRRAPGSAAYGVPSVLAQLACDVRVHRSVARTVFHPVPNVDSVLVLLERTRPGARPASCARSCRARSPTAARRSPRSLAAARRRDGAAESCATRAARRALRWRSGSPRTCAPSA